MTKKKSKDGSKLDECKLHKPYVWERGWRVLGILPRKNSTGWGWEIFCPCINCLNGRQQVVDDIREHLLCDGIKKNYTTWMWHGELTNIQKGSQTEHVDVEMGDRLEDMIHDLG